MYRHDAHSRPDRALIVALAVILATASAALGSAMTWRPVSPPTEHVVRLPQAAPDPALAQLVAEHRCLAEALYYEARGEGRSGQKAVAEVVFHRMNAGNYGHSICAVVYEGASRPGCQFSFTCDGSLHRARETGAWEKSERLAAEILTGQVALRDTTGGATFYHAASVSPYWATALEQTVRIGHHIFYRGGLRTRDS